MRLQLIQDRLWIKILFLNHNVLKFSCFWKKVR